jgi:hypothetical protein
MPKPFYLERALFVVGNRNTGKSTQLRSMCLDLRFGYDGEIPERGRMSSVINLSNERKLFIKLDSPHEEKLSIDEWLDKVDADRSGRWCFAGALHPIELYKMPDLKASVKAFHKRFLPERIRVCFLSPDKDGQLITEAVSNINALVDSLRRIDGVECMFIDARSKTANGLVLADFFDFT